MTEAPLPQATLCYLIKENQVLLAMKKRGFGVHKWNGVGGKLNPGETLEQATIRETQEEIVVTPLDFQKVAILSFYFPDDKKDWNQEVHVYLSNKWQGEPQESEEMQPQWFDINNLPFDQMWSSDKFWLPQVLAGKKLQGEFYFKSAEEVEDYFLQEN